MPVGHHPHLKHRPEHHRQPPAGEGGSAVGIVGLIVGIAAAMGAIYWLGKPATPPKVETPPQHTEQPADTSVVSVPIEQPEATGGQGEPPTSQPQPVYPPAPGPVPAVVTPAGQVIQSTPTQPIPYVPKHPKVPYTPPEHNPLVPHKEWGLPKQ